jgi:retron-type reverse transcriptase
MKSFGNLFGKLVSFENLYQAALAAAKGKKKQANVGRFFLDLEGNLLALRRRLLDRSYRPGPYFNFVVWEPKERLISAAPFRDRVAHHALCRVIEPLCERRFIYDSWADRVGKGTHRAMDRYQGFARQNRYALKCDIRKFFAGIDHAILKAKLRRVIRCEETLWLTDTIIDAGAGQEPGASYFPGDDLFTPHERRRGLPIGSLTSQLFANIYLDGLDHFVKEVLRQRFYLRYMDDFVVLGDDKGALWEVRQEVARFLGEDRLKIHESKSRVFRTQDGIEFLGFRIWPHRRRLKRESVRRMQRRLRWFEKSFGSGAITLTEIGQRIRCWMGHAGHGDTKKLIEDMLDKAVFARVRVA